jgi:tetratricopeptide (TPR) repeat protein
LQALTAARTVEEHAPMILRYAVAALVLAAAPAARAGNEELARKLYDEGQAAFNAGRFAEAAASFEQSYNESRRPLLLWNLAQAYRRQYEVDHDLSNLRRARVVFGNYSQLAQTEADRAEAIEAQRQVDEQLARDEAAAKAQAQPPPPPPREAPPSRLPGVLVAGAGVLVLVGGVTFGLLAESEAQTVESASKMMPPVPFESVAADESRGQAFAIAAYVLCGVGALAAVAGIVLALKPRLLRPATAYLTPAPGGAAVHF